MVLHAWIPRPSPQLNLQGLPLSVDDRGVLASVDGRRTAPEVARCAGLTLERALCALVKLHDLAALQAAPVEVTAALASYRGHNGDSLPDPIHLDSEAAGPGATSAPPAPPPPPATLVDDLPSPFSAVPTESLLPQVPAEPAAHDPGTDPELALPFAECDPTVVEPEEPVVVPAERTAVDARVLPDVEAEADDWGDEPGTLQDPQARTDDH